jgi:hypothetical protein
MPADFAPLDVPASTILAVDDDTAAERLCARQGRVVWFKYSGSRKPAGAGISG